MPKVGQSRGSSDNQGKHVQNSLADTWGHPCRWGGSGADAEDEITGTVQQGNKATKSVDCIGFPVSVHMGLKVV